MNPFPVLVVEDDDYMRPALVDTLRARGFEVEAVKGGNEALERLDAEPFAVVLTDLRMPGMDGMALLAAIKERGEGGPEVVLMTAFGTIETAVSAMKLGAYDYVTKPFSFDEIESVLLRVREKAALLGENRRLKAELRARRGVGAMVGKSEPMQKIYDLIERVAASPATVLVTGESGTGKELVAAALHERSRRRGALVKINCAAMPDTLLESELFGHERGAFTGAVARRAGHFEAAEGGTLFLDEVGDIPLSTQVKLLRAIQDKTVIRVGGTEPVKIDVRLIAATHVELEEAVRQGRFRQDLFFRLNVIPIHLPALRDRRDDIPLLAEHFLARFTRENGRAFRGFTRDALKALVEYPFPGNVRELMNLIERTVVLHDGERVETAMLPPEVRLGGAGVPAGAVSPETSLREVEALHIRRVLEHVAWNLARAARILDIDRKTLYAKIERYGLAKGRPDAPDEGDAGAERP